MRKIVLLSLILSGLPAAVTHAQTTVIEAPYVPATRLEMMETNTGIIVVKASTLVGTIALNEAIIWVKCREDTEFSSGRKEYGAAIGWSAGQIPKSEDGTIVDEDELPALIDAIDTLARLDSSVTRLTSFDATFETKAGLRVSAFSVQRSGSIEHSVRNLRMNRRAVLTRGQLAELKSLIEEAKRKIGELRGK